MLKDDEPCRVCGSPYTLFVQDVLGKRTLARFPQRFCMDCRSLFHTSGYVETDAQQQSDFWELLEQRENHVAIQAQLVLELVTRKPHVRSVLEVGHGTGFFLKACEDFGRSAIGFEVNPHCHRFALHEVGVTSVLGMFDEHHEPTYDLIAANQVLEHLEHPRALFEVMVAHLARDGCIYIGVPFVERDQWPYLWTAGSEPQPHPPDPFFDNDVHITHFSVEGLRRLGLSMGAREAEYFVSEDTFHHSPGAYHGVLFSF